MPGREEDDSLAEEKEFEERHTYWYWCCVCQG